MDSICRLCCSTKFVNNYIFDEENALYLKMSLYLPIKVFKNDRLPQMVCDRCSCKVNDFYQFCNETIAVQNRLRALLVSSAHVVEDSIDLTLIKENDASPLPPSSIAPAPPVPPSSIAPYVHKEEPHTNHEEMIPSHIASSPTNTAPPNPDWNILSIKLSHDQSTQTDIEPIKLHETVASNDSPNKHDLGLLKHIKKEPESSIEVEVKLEEYHENEHNTGLPSDCSEDEISLVEFKKKKMTKKNGQTRQKPEKKKRKARGLKQWQMLVDTLPEGTTLAVVDNTDIKLEVKPELFEGQKIKKVEPFEYHCCVCFVQCYSREEMLNHYKEHEADCGDLNTMPTVPVPPDTDPLRCTRCMRTLQASEWAAHWRRHWERDRRPFRCAVCEKTFRQPHLILKHGLTHKLGEEGADSPPPDKRYLCDLCPEAFVYMRHLLAHRTRAHPEAAGRALALRCASCARTFAHLNSLRRHQRAHSGARDFLCNICGKALSSREHLKFHLRIHTGYKPNVCKVCGKGFVKKCNLTLHERVHSGEKPHVCATCGKAFSQRSTLVIHERYHSGARPYACALCGRGFVAKGLLSMHLKTTCI